MLPSWCCTSGWRCVHVGWELVQQLRPGWVAGGHVGQANLSPTRRAAGQRPHLAIYIPSTVVHLRSAEPWNALVKPLGQLVKGQERCK